MRCMPDDERASRNWSTGKSMTGIEALEMVNGMFTLMGQEPIRIDPPPASGRPGLEAVLTAYIARLRAVVPRYQGIEDKFLPDAIVQQLRAELQREE